MKTSTIHRLAVAGALSLGLAASAASAQDRPPAPGAPQGQASAPRGLGVRGPQGPDRQQRFAEIRQGRERRLHDLLQIRPDQDAAFRAFLAALEQARPQRTQRPDAQGPGAQGPGGRRGPGAQLTTPERLDRLNQRMAERQQRLQRTTAAVKAFYAVLSPEQRRAFDELPIVRIGARHDGGRWGGRGFGAGRFG